jgi:Mg/Co/Ni transporter MgtE
MTRRLKKSVLAGAFVGLILFVVAGFLPSAYTGGLFGLKLAELLFGTPLEPSAGPRVLVAFWMVLSVILSGAIFVVGCAIIGWILGFLIEKKRVREKSSLS